MGKVVDGKGLTKGNYKSRAVLGFLVGILFVAIAVMFAISCSDYMIKGETVNLNETLKDGATPHSGDYVTVDLTGAFFYYCETTHKVNGIPTGKDFDYLVLINDDTLMSVTVKGKKNKAEYEKFCDEFYDALTVTGIPPAPKKISGKVSSLYGDKKKYYDQGIRNELGITSADGYNIISMTIETSETRGKLMLITAGIAAFAVLMFAMGVSNSKKAKNFVGLASNVATPMDTPAAPLEDISDIVANDNNNSDNM